jgi:hypothetical protein
VTLANVPDEVELREQQLPPEADWAIAVERAGGILGVASPSPLLNASNLAKLADDIQGRAKEKIEACRRLVKDLEAHLHDFGEPVEKAPRYQTAEAVLNLLEAVRDAKPAAVIKALASLTPRTSEAAMGTSFASAGEVVGALAGTQWKLFESIRKLQDERSTAAGSLLGRVSSALKSDQHVAALGPVLTIEQSKAIDLLTPPPKPPVGEPPVPKPKPPDGAPPPPPIRPGKTVVEKGALEDLNLVEAEEAIAQVREKSKGNRVARINVSWVIEE